MAEVVKKFVGANKDLFDTEFEAHVSILVEEYSRIFKNARHTTDAPGRQVTKFVISNYNDVSRLCHSYEELIKKYNPKK